MLTAVTNICRQTFSLKLVAFRCVYFNIHFVSFKNENVSLEEFIWLVWLYSSNKQEHLVAHMPWICTWENFPMIFSCMCLCSKFSFPLKSSLQFRACFTHEGFCSLQRFYCFRKEALIRSGPDEQELATPILSLCHGFIYRLTYF